MNFSLVLIVGYTKMATRPLEIIFSVKQINTKNKRQCYLELMWGEIAILTQLGASLISNRNLCLHPRKKNCCLKRKLVKGYERDLCRIVLLISDVNVRTTRSPGVKFSGSTNPMTGKKYV